MSGLLLAVLKIGFLLAMWLFILFIANIIRTDMFGRRATDEEVAAAVDDPRPGKLTRKQRQELKSQPRLTVVAGRANGTSVPLVGEISLGRTVDSTLDIDDDYASGRHARLYRDAQGWIVEDLTSTNGTYVNGVRIQDPTRITPDDIIRIGRTQLKLEV